MSKKECSQAGEQRIIPELEHITHQAFGKPDRKFRYYDLQGRLVLIECRWDRIPNLRKKKEVHPYSLVVLEGVLQWAWKAPKNSVQPYGSEKIGSKMNKILVVESANKADAASRMFEELDVIATRGSNSVKGFDFSALEGRDVILWRDNDDPGSRWEQKLCSTLRPIAKSLSLVQIPAEFPARWDLADEIPQGWNLEKLVQMINNATPFEKSASESSERENSKTVVVVELIDSIIKDIFVDQYGDPIVRIAFDGKYPICISLRSQRVRSFIRGTAYSQLKVGITDSTLNEALSLFEGKAIAAGKRVELKIRVSEHGGEICYDLGDAIVRISKKGFRTETDPPNLFKFYPILKEQTHPSLEKVCLNELMQLINVPGEKDRLLLKCFIITCFVPEISHPMLVVYGDQGSAKSTLMKLLTRLIDPSINEGVQLFHKEDLIQNISHRWLLPVDNISPIKEELSNLLCQAITGGSHSKRKLYTNDDDFFTDFKGVVVINGINLPVSKPDLLDRSLLLELNRLPDNQRVGDKDIFERFDQIKPGLLASCFDSVSKAMRLLDEVKESTKGKLPRMADFTIWACAAAKAMGYRIEDFLEVYAENRSRQNDEAIEASPIGAAIHYYLSIHSSLHGTPTEVMRKLSHIWEGAGLDPTDRPRSVHSFGKQIREVQTNLIARGYRADISKSGSRSYAFTKPKDAQHVQVTNPLKDAAVEMDVCKDRTTNRSVHDGEHSRTSLGDLDEMGVCVPETQLQGERTGI